MVPQHSSRPLWIAVALLALLAPLAVAAGLASPAQAAAPRTHHLTTYKVEAHVDLSGEFPDNTLHTHLYCRPGDYALDGMWRVDHVDQANPPDTFGDERDVQVDASYGDDGNPAEWHFRFVNNADGDAQLKIFVTCIDNSTQGQHGHSHPIVLSSRYDDNTNLALPSGSSSIAHATECTGANEVAVAPGFNFTSGNGRIFRSWPSMNTRNWSWAFVVNGPADVSVYHRCLAVKTGAGGNGPHAHRVFAGWFPGVGGDFGAIPVSTGFERRYSCESKAYDKGMVGAFWIDDPTHVWWLGMDPRPKSRAFRFWNDSLSGNGTYVALLCVGSRTGKQIAP